MTRRYLLPLGTILLAGILPAQTAPATAGTPPPPPSGRGPGGFRGGPGDGFGPLSEKRLTQRLGLTAEQQNAVHTAIEEGRVMQKGMAQKEGDARTRLATAVRAGDEAKIDSVSAEVSQLHQQRTAIQAKTWAKLYATLTPDQKTKIEGEMNRALGVPGGGGPGRGARPRDGRRPPPPPPPPAQQ